MPNVVKGSKQEKMVVVPYRPGRRAFRVMLILLACASAGAAGFFVGEFRIQQTQEVVQQDLNGLNLELADLRLENSELRREVAILDRSSQMDQAATEEVNSTIRGLRERIAQLEQDVVFYRQVVSEETGTTGLVIGQFDISATNTPNRFRYKLVMRQQDADGDTFLTGHVNVNLVGRQGDEQVIIPLREVSENEEQLDIRLRFKYFQNIEGELALPEAFEPERVQIAAVATEPVAKSIDQDFSWVVEGE